VTPLRPFVLLAAVILTYAQGPAGLSIGLLVVMVNELLAFRLRVMAWDEGGIRLPRWLRWPFQRERREPFPTFDSVSSDVSWATKSGRDFDLYIRKRFTRIARAKLLDLNLDLDMLADDPPRARAVLGADLWWVVDPTREQSKERESGGVDPAQLHRLLDQLESIGADRRGSGTRA